VQWLYPRLDFYTWDVPGAWYDIGSLDQLEEADVIFSQ
jgi:glucose-1-phosphate thymidylyltransferase